MHGETILSLTVVHALGVHVREVSVNGRLAVVRFARRRQDLGDAGLQRRPGAELCPLHDAHDARDILGMAHTPPANQHDTRPPRAATIRHTTSR